MLRITQLALPPDHQTKQLTDKICSILQIGPQDMISMTVRKRSVDARKRPQIVYVYTVDVVCRNEERILKRLRGKKNVQKAEECTYAAPEVLAGRWKNREGALRPVVVGSGPAGLFCALLLSRCGLDL